MPDAGDKVVQAGPVQDFAAGGGAEIKQEHGVGGGAGQSGQASSGIHPAPPGQVIPSQEVLEKMTHAELQAFYHRSVSCNLHVN